MHVSHVLHLREGLVTVEEVAVLLRVSKSTVTRMCQRGDLPAIKAGRAWRISKTAISKIAGVIA